MFFNKSLVPAFSGFVIDFVELQNLEYIHIFMMAVGSRLSGPCIKVETQIKVPKLMAEY